MKDRDAIAEFVLVFIKLFLFYIMLQFVGFFDDANNGYCRGTDGCNIETTITSTTTTNRKKKNLNLYKRHK
jgi:hypothetical protein